MENNRCFGCMEEKKNHPICEHCGWDEGQQNLPHQLPTGTVLRDQYLIGRVLKQESLFITYLGWDQYLEMPVAIREYYPVGMVSRNVSDSLDVACCTGAETYEENKKHLMRQGRELGKFRELKNIVQVLSFFPENNTVYLVTEHSEGQTLRQYVKENGTMQLPQILQLLGPLMEDLQKLNEESVIHREINPNQILLDNGGRARLLDFGAGAFTDPDQENSGVIRSSEKFNSRFRPVEIYMPQGSLGAWTDVYSLCGTICFCLNGRGPAAYADRSVAENPNDFIDALTIPENQKQIFCRGMAMKPRERTGSVAELLAELTESLEEESEPDRSFIPGGEKQTKPSKEEPECRKKNISPKKPHTWNKTIWIWLLASGLVVVLAATEFDNDPQVVWLLAVVMEAILTLECLLLECLLLNFGRWVEIRSTEPTAPVKQIKKTPNFRIEDQVLKNFDSKGISAFAFGTEFKKRDVAEIEFLNSLENVPEYAADISETGNGKVLLWGEPNQNGQVRLYIAGEGKIYFPKQSQYLFGSDIFMEKDSYFSSLRMIDFSNVVDTSQVANMGWMFSACRTLKELDLSCFDTSQVKDMSGLFSYCGFLEKVDLGNRFDTSRVADMSKMFVNCHDLKEENLYTDNQKIIEQFRKDHPQ